MTAMLAMEWKSVTVAFARLALKSARRTCAQMVSAVRSLAIVCAAAVSEIVIL
jgi:hypothetical protein